MNGLSHCHRNHVYMTIAAANPLMCMFSLYNSTDTGYEDSMIVKNFMFTFVNSYASFFFIGEVSLL